MRTNMGLVLDRWPFPPKSFYHANPRWYHQ